eukprot:gnl/TRDRNA2_/TRDRNA2_37373_c0_seq1.p1 gnl/TRDRNA2_/TRDRNA2_37373_c0~~gnl/TRDRNA2_/TRDRNA2_37373_c0_seq1.p1  ORF type:complete len:864 (-),score=130.51 gnl/TRDRNA2_/TRDRNA2_37373_c0_seq1:249-2840(-)
MKQMQHSIISFFMLLVPVASILPYEDNSAAVSREIQGRQVQGHLRATVSGWLQKAEHATLSVMQEGESQIEQLVVHELDREVVRFGPGGRRQQLHFRPVSCTLWCVMVLIVVCLVVYTCLAIARNVDELSGKNEPSAITDILTAAARVTALPPMLCMLFVACRMYTLAATQGFGEPPLWVKACMVVASCGIVLQILLVLALSAATERKERGDKFSDHAGEDNDVHPQLNTHQYAHWTLGKIVFWFLQGLCLLFIYGGVLGVIVGIVIFPGGSVKVSSAVICTVVLSVLYFSCYLLLWTVRTANLRRGGAAARAAAQCAVNAVQKAPMMAILFLASRMRALQLDPPHGMPPVWAQACFFTMTGMLILECLAAAYVGATGRESHSYYGYYLYRAHPCAHVLQHTCSLVIYACLIPVIVAICVMKTGQGDYHALSPMMIAILWLQVLYFGVLLVRWTIFVMEDVCLYTLKTAQETVLATGISVSFAPLLCVLFLACRMRALQVSDQQGNPQAWAQDCFFICVFATYVQALCCLALPIFTGAATQVDGDGNPTCDLRPMIGGYAVCIVKYVALLCLHGGVIVIIISIFTITPQAALSSKHGTERGVVEVLIGIALVLLVLLLAILASTAKAVGMAIKMGIESVDRVFLGVDISIEKANFSVCEGYVNVSNMTVCNPDDHEWRSDCMMHVDQMVVEIAMWRLIKSLGSRFEVTTCVMKHVQLNFEKSVGQSSNVQMVIEHIDYWDNLIKSAGLDKLASVDTPPQAVNDHLRECSDNCKKLLKLKPPCLTLHALKIEDVAATAVLEAKGIHVTVGDLHFDSFMMSQCQGKEACGVGEIVGIVVKMIMQTVLQNRKVLAHGLGWSSPSTG